MWKTILLCILFCVGCDRHKQIKTANKDVGVNSERKILPTSDFEINRFPSEILTVMSWNLHWFPGRGMVATEGERSNHITAAREIIAKHPADIICFQEVCDKKATQELISALPDYELHIVSNFPGRQQVAIASSIQPVAGYQQDFHPAGTHPPRGFAFAAYREGDSYTLVYCVHLKSNLGDFKANILKREESARQLISHCQKVSNDFKAQGAKNVAVIIAGDFNTDPVDERYSKEQTSAILMKADFQWSWEGVGFNDRVTWKSNGKYPDACFDHFFYRGVDRANCLVVTLSWMTTRWHAACAPPDEPPEKLVTHHFL